MAHGQKKIFKAFESETIQLQIALATSIFLFCSLPVAATAELDTDPEPQSDSSTKQVLNAPHPMRLQRPDASILQWGDNSRRSLLEPINRFQAQEEPSKIRTRPDEKPLFTFTVPLSVAGTMLPHVPLEVPNLLDLSNLQNQGYASDPAPISLTPKEMTSLAWRATAQNLASEKQSQNHLKQSLNAPMPACFDAFLRECQMQGFSVLDKASGAGHILIGMNESSDQAKIIIAMISIDGAVTDIHIKIFARRPQALGSQLESLLNRVRQQVDQSTLL